MRPSRKRPSSPCSPHAHAHCITANVRKTASGGKREINIASGTLDRPIKEIVASLQHETVHMWNDTVMNVQDCSRVGQYHNRHFAQEAVMLRATLCFSFVSFAPLMRLNTF